MTYSYNKEQHTAKIKAGLETAKKKGKKLGRPKGGKIKGEDEVIDIYINGVTMKIGDEIVNYKYTYDAIAKITFVSIGTVQKIINKYKKNDK